MAERDDIDGLAAEYVLGTLDAGERASVAARRQREAALDAAITNWERRLAPLSDTIAEVEPPRGLLRSILARIDGGAGANVVELTRRIRFWKGLALAAGAVAASLAILIGTQSFAPSRPTQNLVAVLQKDAESPAFLVTVNVDDRVMTVKPIAAKHEPGKSYELWLVHDELGAPRSLGVIDDPNAMVRPTLAGYKPDVIETATFAVSLEPEGGSPSGAPTGPVVFAGKVLNAPRK